MGMVCNLRQASEVEINKLLEKPEYITEFLYGEQQPVQRKGILSLLFGNKPFKPPEPSPEWVRNAERIETDLDKSWHGIHFLLTGTDWEGEEPLCYLIKGGREIGKIDVGYGPARGLNSEEVRKFSDALNGINKEELKKKFDPKKMKELDIYPDIWDSDPKDDDTLGYLIEYFENLRNFVKQAAENNKGLIIFCN